MQASAREALVALKARFRTYSAAAEQLGITRQALRDWRIKGRVSHHRVREVSKLTGIPLERLRPDLYGSDHSTAA